MASVTVSLSEPMRDYVQDRVDSGHYASIDDYVRDLINRDQDEAEKEGRWLRELDASIAESLAEMSAGSGTDLGTALGAMEAWPEATDDQARP